MWVRVKCMCGGKPVRDTTKIVGDVEIERIGACPWCYGSEWIEHEITESSRFVRAVKTDDVDDA